MATEARPAFLANTGRFEHETGAAAARFAACVRDAAGGAEGDPATLACAVLSAQAFGGDQAAWAPLVAAVRRLLAASFADSAHSRRSRQELRAFVAENADLLEA